MTFNFTNNAVIQKKQKMKRRRKSCGSIIGNSCLLVLGVVLISLALSIFIYFDKLYDFMINSALTFNRDSEPFRVWKKNDPMLDMDIYLFNWTNPDDLTTPGIKPRFEEVGPYRFKETKIKINITWHDHNNTISYMHKKLYYFDPENSVRNLSDVITTINAVPLAVAYKIRDYSLLAKIGISVPLTRFSSLYVTKTAGEILFDGYDDPILSTLSSIPFINVKDKFGLFYGKNGTEGDDGVFSMYTKNDKNFGRIQTWNYKNQSDYYDDHCGDVRGSAGEFYPINRKRDHLEFFSSELCKYAILEYEKDVDVKGVLGFKYTAKNIFDNGTLRQENSCFCKGECQPSGVLNVSSCRENSPTFLSMPHFYNADPYYTDSIEGLNPQDKHEFYITLEPKSGIVIDIAARMQVNMLLQPIDYITMYKNVPKIYVPLFYFDQTITVKDDLASVMIVIQNLPEISNVAVLILAGLGFMSLLWLILNIYCCHKQNYEEQKVPQNTYEEIPLRS